MDKNKRFELGTWLPAIFCFFLAAMQAAIGLGQLSAAYLWFLPICFVYVGMGQLALHRRIAELEARRAAPPPTSP